MARGTLGTGMMAPLSMADNFHGDYYAGPSGAAIGALMASQAIGDGFRDWGAAKGRRQDEAKKQAEKDRVLAQDMATRKAVAQTINPIGYAEGYGDMGNRPGSAPVLPEVGTQLALNKLVQDKQAKEQEADYKKKSAFAQAWAAKRGYAQDPTGEKFQSQVGYSPFEYEGVSDIIARAEEKDAQMRWQQQMKEDGYTQAQILARIAAGNKAPKRELFVDPKSGKYVWMNEGEDIPQGLVPHANNMGVTVNSDGTTTINTGGSLKSIPTSAVSSLTGNFSTLSKIGSALAANEAAPGSTGSWKGMLNDVAPSLLNKLYSDEDEVLARAATADIGSMIIHDRSGAAVTISEYPRLRPFIPTMYDSDEEKKTKLKQLRAAIAEETRLYADNFGPEMGYKRPKSWDKYLAADTQSQPSGQKEQSAGGGGLGGDEPPAPEGFEVLP